MVIPFSWIPVDEALERESDIEKLYPDEKLFYLVNEENFKLYNGFNREEMVSDFCRDILKNYVDENKIFHCYSKN